MFQNLTQGSVVYMLRRDARKYEEGKVLSVSTHVPQYNAAQPMAMLNGLVTDITVQSGSDTMPFLGLPANAVVADFPDKGMFIAVDKSSVVREVENMRTVSKNALEQVPMHEEIVKDCDSLLLSLQPEKRKEAEQEQKLQKLESRLDDIMRLLAERLGDKT